MVETTESPCHVQIRAFGLNRMDISQREGKYPPPKGASMILGVEFSGHIVGLGKDVMEWKEGDEVLGLAGGVHTAFSAFALMLQNSHRTANGDREHMRSISSFSRRTLRRNQTTFHGQKQPAFRKTSSLVRTQTHLSDLLTD